MTRTLYLFEDGHLDCMTFRCAAFSDESLEIFDKQSIGR